MPVRTEPLLAIRAPKGSDPIRAATALTQGDLAELAGDGGALAALNTSLREEKDMAQWIADHLDATVRRFVERSAAGQTAGV